VLDDNYVANYPKSIRERILEVSGIEDIKVADTLTADNVLMVEMDATTVREIVGLDVTTIEWEVEGGMILKYKVMAILVPQIRAEQALGYSGVVHLA